MGFEPDVNRRLDQFATLAELAAERGLEVTMEFGPRLGVGDLPVALATTRQVGRTNFRLLIDTMHLVRSGSSAADLDTVDSNLIGYVQLCDVPLVSQFSDWSQPSFICGC